MRVWSSQSASLRCPNSPLQPYGWWFNQPVLRKHCHEERTHRSRLGTRPRRQRASRLKSDTWGLNVTYLLKLRGEEALRISVVQTRFSDCEVALLWRKQKPMCYISVTTFPWNIWNPGIALAMLFSPACLGSCSKELSLEAGWWTCGHRIGYHITSCIGHGVGSFKRIIWVILGRVFRRLCPFQAVPGVGAYHHTPGYYPDTQGWGAPSDSPDLNVDQGWAPAPTYP